MDHLRRSLLNYFSMQPLNREAHLRADEQWIQKQQSSPESRFYAFNNEMVLTVDDLPLCLNAEQFNLFESGNPATVFLGTESGLTFFTVNFEDLQAVEGIFPKVKAKSLRDIADSTDMKTASILAYAKLMNRWLLGYNFCRRCGHKYIPRQGGHVLKCSSQTCSHVEFPRINPAVIMRVTCGDKILLARQRKWPQHRYSVLAGFVEPGETLEHAVAREIKEESGIEIEEVVYHSSQPWPFPNSLMIGYCATTRDMALDIENDDLETAIWLNADELTEQMDARSVILSPPISISHRLIEDWFMAQTGRSIKEWQTLKPEHIVHENE